jgi:hypothetical protein
MKTSKIWKLITLGSLLITSTAYGDGSSFNFDGDIYVPAKDSGITNGRNGANGSGRVAPDLTINSETINCKKESDGHISLKYLKTLMMGDDLSIARVSGQVGVANQYNVTVPSLVTGGQKDSDEGGVDQQCFSLKITPSQTDHVKVSDDENAKYFYLTFKNKIDLTWDKFIGSIESNNANKVTGKKNDDGDTRSWKGITKESWENMNEEQKVTACLLGKGVIKEKGAGYSYKDNMEPKYKSTLDTEPVSPLVTDDGDLSKIFLAAASPLHAKPAFGSIGNLNVGVPGGKGEKCLNLEKIDDGDGLPIVYQNGLLKDAINVCSSGDVRAIDQMLNQLRTDFKNTEAYQLSVKLLTETRDEALDAKADELYRELKEIGKEIKSAYKGGKWKIEEDEARDLLAKYADTLRELNRQVYDSYTVELNQRIENRKNLRGELREENDKRIKEINEKLAYLSKNDKKFYKRTVEKLAERFALTDSALDVEGFYLKSEYMARVRPVSRDFDDKRMRRLGKTMTMDDANDKIEKLAEKYERKTEEWTLDADARDGDYYPAKRARHDMDVIRKRQARDRQRFQQNEQRYQRYCQATFGGFQMNPVRCRQYMSPQSRARRQQRFARRNASHQAAYANASRTYQRRRGYAEEARRRLADDEDEYDSYGYYYDGYDDFDDFGFDNDYGFDDGFHMGSYNMGMMGGNTGNPYGGPARRNMGYSQFQPQQQQFGGQQALPYSMNFMSQPQQQFGAQQFGGPQRRF